MKKDNITKPLIFIFIAPDSIVDPTKICFSEFVYQDYKIKEIDNNKYFINIMQSKTPEGTIIENKSNFKEYKIWMMSLKRAL